MKSKLYRSENSSSDIVLLTNSEKSQIGLKDERQNFDLRPNKKSDIKLSMIKF
mgnify:CR=1 FL=1